MVSTPVRWPTRRPARPRASSATSGFFFCGSIEDPVAHASSRTRKPNSSRRPQHHLLADAAEVDPEERQGEERLGHEVPVGHGVEAVLERTGEAEVGGDADGVEGQGGAGERAGAEGADVEAAAGVQQAVEVPSEGPPVGQEVVGQQHR